MAKKGKSPVKTIVISLLVGIGITVAVLFSISAKNQKLVDAQQEMIKIANQIDLLGTQLGDAPTQEETKKVAEEMAEKSDQILVLSQILVDGSKGDPHTISLKKHEVLESQNQRIKKIVELTNLKNANGPEGKKIIQELGVIKANTERLSQELKALMAGE